MPKRKPGGVPACLDAAETRHDIVLSDPLRRLPQEVRDQIFAYVLEDPFNVEDAHRDETVLDAKVQKESGAVVCETPARGLSASCFQRMVYSGISTNVLWTNDSRRILGNYIRAKPGIRNQVVSIQTSTYHWQFARLARLNRTYYHELTANRHRYCLRSFDCPDISCEDFCDYLEYHFKQRPEAYWYGSIVVDGQTWVRFGYPNGWPDTLDLASVQDEWCEWLPNLQKRRTVENVVKYLKISGVRHVESVTAS